MTEQMKKRIKDTICNCLRRKLSNYRPESNYMPFHHHLLGKDRMALFSFIHSLNTTFRMSIFEPVAVVLAENRFKLVMSQYVVGDTIYSNCQREIYNILNSLSAAESRPNKISEIERLRKNLSGSKSKLKPVKVDLFLIDHNDMQYMFDLKSPKPNKNEFNQFKTTLLTWAGIAMTKESHVQVQTMAAITYNPYFPNPYERWTMAGMLDVANELRVAEEFWDFLGGEGTYEHLLDCFEKAGIEMRSEIDNYFKTFVK